MSVETMSNVASNLGLKDLILCEVSHVKNIEMVHNIFLHNEKINFMVLRSIHQTMKPLRMHFTLSSGRYENLLVRNAPKSLLSILSRHCFAEKM